MKIPEPVKTGLWNLLRAFTLGFLPKRKRKAT